MSLLAAKGGPASELSSDDLRDTLHTALASLGDRRRVLAVPPDFTRRDSQAGLLTQLAYQFYGSRLTDVLPALGTHTPMSDQSIATMFGNIPRALFRDHNWRTDTRKLGEIPSSFLREQSEGKLDYTWPVEVNQLVVGGDFDLILSIGQVVPHEVAGMANHSKNILVGTGGREAINRSHYLGAVYGMERIMGRADNPVRRVFNYAVEHFLHGLPIVYVQTVVARNAQGRLVVRGIFIGDDLECFYRAAELANIVNFQRLKQPVKKAVVYLDPHEYHSTWLGNKAIYRTRMALADDAELIVMGPGVNSFGEDPSIDRLIRKYGYRGTPATLAAVASHPELAADLSAAAHLIHGSSEGRFRVTWCAGGLSREEVESVGFQYADCHSMLRRYDPDRLRHGWNANEAGDLFYISNPGLGLWSYESSGAERNQTS